MVTSSWHSFYIWFQQKKRLHLFFQPFFFFTLQQHSNWIKTATASVAAVVITLKQKLLLKTLHPPFIELYILHSCSTVKLNQHDFILLTMQRNEWFFLNFPSRGEKALSLCAGFLCIVVHEWDFHGVQGFLYGFFGITPTSGGQEVEKWKKCIHVSTFSSRDKRVKVFSHVQSYCTNSLCGSFWEFIKSISWLSLYNIRFRKESLYLNIWTFFPEFSSITDSMHYSDNVQYI